VHSLVTGGAGFLGSHLCDALLAEGHSVVAVDNLLTGRIENLAHLSGEPRFDLEKCDICQPFDFGKVDFVFHFACPASPKDYMTHGLATLRVGSNGTFNALELSRKYNAKFLLASGSAVYGIPEIQPQDESYWGFASAVGPRSVYVEAKRLSEVAAVAYRRYYQTDTRIARIFYTYGPRMKLRDGRVVSAFMEQALRGQDLTIFGDGTQCRSFSYVSEIIEGVLRLAWSDVHEPVNFGNPVKTSVLDCAQTVLAVTASNSRIVHLELPEEDPHQQQPDISRARNLLKWEPKIDLESGLQLCLEYFEGAVAITKEGVPLRVPGFHKSKDSR
jgi:dTDP-glucose 4,6-dehydratase